MQPVTWDMSYTEGYTLAMVHAASHGAVIKNQGIESVLDSNLLLPSWLENLMSLLDLQFACPEIRDDNACIMEIL